MTDMELQHAISTFVLDGAMHLDYDELEAWADNFDEDGRYVVLPRDNKELGYAVGLMHCASKAILMDRISVLRNANKFNPHWDRHILCATQVLRKDGDFIIARTNFMALQTTLNGVTELFCTGAYEDKIRATGDKLSLAERIVVLDTFAVSNCMATPI